MNQTLAEALDYTLSTPSQHLCIPLDYGQFSLSPHFLTNYLFYSDSLARELEILYSKLLHAIILRARNTCLVAYILIHITQSKRIELLLLQMWKNQGLNVLELLKKSVIEDRILLMNFYPLSFGIARTTFSRFQMVLNQRYRLSG